MKIITFNNLYNFNMTCSYNFYNFDMGMPLLSINHPMDSCINLEMLNEYEEILKEYNEEQQRA